MDTRKLKFLNNLLCGDSMEEAKGKVEISHATAYDHRTSPTAMRKPHLRVWLLEQDIGLDMAS